MVFVFLHHHHTKIAKKSALTAFYFREELWQSLFECFGNSFFLAPRNEAREAQHIIRKVGTQHRFVGDGQLLHSHAVIIESDVNEFVRGLPIFKKMVQFGKTTRQIDTGITGFFLQKFLKQQIGVATTLTNGQIDVKELFQNLLIVV